jgi:hypothetical protein
MLVMVDAMVLIYALGVETKRISRTAAYWRNALASHELIMESGTVAMAAISWYEVLRGMTPEQRAALTRTDLRVDVRAIDGNVATRAAELFMATRKPGKVCLKCLGVIKDPNKCSVCGNMRSKDQKSGDIVMVATADVDPDVRILYSWDNGVLTTLADQVKNVQIKEPPQPLGKQMGLLETDISE